MTTVIDRIGRGVHHYDGIGEQPIRIELTDADYGTLQAEFDAASGDLQKLFAGWPDEAFGLPIVKVQGEHSAVVATIPSTPGRSSFVI